MRIAPLALAAALLLTIGGCAAAETPTDDTSQSDTASEDVDDTGGEDAPSSDLVPVLTDPSADGPTVEMTLDGITPPELTIPAGTVITFTSGDDEYHGLVINGLASVTVYNGLTESYQFNDPGQYYVSDDLSDATAVITVE